MLNKKAFILIVFAALAFSGAVVLKNNNTKSLAVPSPTPAPASSYLKEYKTRYYNPTDKFIGDLKYQDIVSEPDEILRPISCSRTEEYDSFSQSAKHSQISPYINAAKEKYPNNELRSLIACSSHDQTIILFSLGPCGGGCSGRPNVGIIKKNSIENTLEIPNEIYTPYYGCQPKPLFLTTDGNFYIACGEIGSNAIYKLELNTFNLTLIKRCANEIDGASGNYSSSYICE